MKEIDESFALAFGKNFFDTLDLIPQSIGILDLNASVVFVNKCFEKENNIPASKLMGKSLLDIYKSQNYRERMFEYFQKMRSMEVKPGTFINKIDGLDSVDGMIVHKTDWDYLKSEDTLLGFIFSSTDTSEYTLVKQNKEIAEEKLHQMKELEGKNLNKLTLALEASNQGLWEWDIATDEIEYDDRYFQMLGYQKEDFIAVPNVWAHLVHPEDIEKYNTWFDLFLRGKIDKYEVRYRMKSASGKWVWILDKGQIIKKDKNGKPSRMIGVHLDIDEIMTKNKKIEELNENLEFAMNVSGAGVWEFKFADDFINSQKRFPKRPKDFKRLLDGSDENFIKSFDLVHPDDKERLYDTLFNCQTENKERISLKIKVFFVKYNAYRWVFVEGEIKERNENGRLVRMIGTYKDINDIKLKEKEIIQTNERLEFQKKHTDELNKILIERNFELNYTKKLLEMVLKSAKMGISKYNLRKNTSQYDDVCSTIFGYDPSSGTDMPWLGQVLDEYKEYVLSTVFDYCGSVIPEYDVQYQFRRPDGKIIWIHEKGEIVEYDDEGRPLLLLGSVKDITAQKEFERLLVKAKEDAEKVSVLKSDLVSNVNHELRTPLTIIMGLTETMLMSEQDPDKQRFLNQIFESSNRLLELISDVLDLSKIESGSKMLKQTKTQIRAFIRNYFSDIQIQAEKKKLKTRYMVDKDVPVYIKIDQGKLIQIMNNLFGNALKYTEKGQIGIRISLEKDNIAFYIFDTGIGIPSKDQKKVFDRFHQVDSSIRRKYNGTGLGLSIVKELINLMSGRISVTSIVGKGSCFKFTLPLVTKTSIDRKSL